MKALDEPTRQARVRSLCRIDLFFLLRFVIGRKDMHHQWLLDRCREVEQGPNGYLDLWSREHYKSTIITYGKTLQDILASHGDNPLPEWEGREVTVGIFSHTRPIAKKFLVQIKQTCQQSALLKELFPDVLWADPRNEAPRWSDDGGLVFKRKSPTKESTVEAWGVVDGQPTSSHFDILVYDDVVTKESVTTPDMIEKTTDALALSYNLGARGGYRRFIGTRYHFNDSYRTVMERGTAKPRIYPATVDGDITGDPVLLTAEQLAEKRRDMGPYIFGAQMMQNPTADETQGFKEEWLKFYDGHNEGSGLNVYLLFDPANEKKKTSDYTAGWVLGLGPDGNYYPLEIVRDRLNLTQRVKLVMDLHRKYSMTANVLGVGYEKYGIQADIQAIEAEQTRQNYRFDITPLGGQVKKEDRIKTLIPLFEQGKIYLPRTCYKTDYEGKTEDLVQAFIEQEYKPFPVPVHDDMLDSLARINDPDLNLVWPKPVPQTDRYSSKAKRGSHMAA